LRSDFENLNFVGKNQKKLVFIAIVEKFIAIFVDCIGRVAPRALKNEIEI